MSEIKTNEDKQYASLDVEVIGIKTCQTKTKLDTESQALIRKKNHSNKISKCMFVLFFARSSVDIGIFTYESSFWTVGYIQGIFITLVIMYINAYGCWLAATLCDDIESESKKEDPQCYTFHGKNIFLDLKIFKKIDCAIACSTPQYQTIAKIFAIIMMSLANFAAVVSNVTYSAEFFTEELQ